MKTHNRLDKSFGPAGTFAGVIVFTAEIILTFFHFSGVLLILTGGFFGFTNSGVTIDFDLKRVKFSNNIFGIIPTGKWLRILPAMKIGIRESTRTYRAFSQGNRALDVTKTDFRIVLIGADDKEIMQLARADSPESAKASRDSIGNRLGLKIT